MTRMLLALAHPLELRAFMREEILPIALFFGMFFAVFGLGGMVIRHLPRKSGSMLDEILNETWEDAEDIPPAAKHALPSEAPAQPAEDPAQPQTDTETDTADG